MFGGQTNQMLYFAWDKLEHSVQKKIMKNTKHKTINV